MNSFAFVIPVYMHGITLAPIVEELARFQYPIILVDDGNPPEVCAYLEQARQSCPLVHIVTRAKNGGKGAAVISGMFKAEELGVSHALQLDADGQHDIKRTAYFLEQSRQNPRAVICGYPEYDASVPASRRNGHAAANFFVHMMALSAQPADALCGFRVYPVQEFCRIVRRHILDKRMGFDVEVMIHFAWAAVPVISCPVAVTYPQDGISNYHLFRDNVRVTFMFFKMFFGMILRLPLFAVRSIFGTRT